MSEEQPIDIPDGRTFEARVFMRFDALESRLKSLDIRPQEPETESEEKFPEHNAWKRLLATVEEMQ